MDITIIDDIENTGEQIKKKNSVSEFLYRSVEKVLAEDRFNFFNSKSTFALDREILKTNDEIDKLIRVNMDSKEKGKNLKKQYKALKQDNLKSIEELKMKIGS